MIITPYLMDPIFLKRNSRVLKYRNVKNISPEKIEVSLCEAIVNNRKTFDQLVKTIKDNPGISITPYAVTNEFISLISKLKKLNLKFKSLEIPSPKSLWTVKYLDSKSGFREAVNKIKGDNKINLPQGFICRDIEEADKISKWFLRSGKSCVLKANFGESGWGLKVLRDRAKIEGEDAYRDDIWTNTIIVVEEYINRDTEVAGGSPSVEILVNKEGAQITYICGQTVDSFGSFEGVSLGKNILECKDLAELKRLGLILGKEYWKLGYRGYFDLDTVVEKKSRNIYLIETNTRRTGGTHTYDIAKRLFGSKWEEKSFLISNDQFPYSRKIKTPEAIFDRLDNILYPKKTSGSGVIITIIDAERHMLGFVIVSKDKSECLKIHTELSNLLS